MMSSSPSSNGSPPPPPDPPRGQTGFVSAQVSDPFSGNVTLIQKWKIKVTKPKPANNAASSATGPLPFCPLCRELLNHIKAIDSAAQLLPVPDDSPTQVSLAKVEELPTGDRLKQYFADVQEQNFGRDIVFYVKVQSKAKLSDFKNDGSFYNFLCASKVWITVHKHPSNYVRGVGFIAMMHPAFDNRDKTAKIIQDHLTMPILFTLNMTKIHTGRKDTYLTSDAIEIQVEASKLEQARIEIVDAFERAKPLLNGKLFIPYPKREVMHTDVYRHFVAAHMEHLSTTRSVSIRGVKDMAGGPFSIDDTTYPSLFSFIQSATADSHGNALFDSWQPTQSTETDGRVILLTDAKRFDMARAALDRWTDEVNVNSAFLTEYVLPDRHLCRSHRPPQDRFTRYTASLSAMIPHDVVIPVAPKRCQQNAWSAGGPRRRTTLDTIDLTSDDVFPRLPTTAPAKRTKRTPATETDSHTLATSTSDYDHLQSQIDAMKSSLLQLTDNFASQHKLVEHNFFTMNTNITNMQHMMQQQMNMVEHQQRNMTTTQADLDRLISALSAPNSATVTPTNTDTLARQRLAALTVKDKRHTPMYAAMLRTNAPSKHDDSPTSSDEDDDVDLDDDHAAATILDDAILPRTSRDRSPDHKQRKILSTKKSTFPTSAGASNDEAMPDAGPNK